METEKGAESVAEKFEGKIRKHFEEPLFVIAIVAVLIAIIKPLFNFALLSFAVLLLGLLSAYFVYVYFKNDVKNYYFIGIPVLIFFITLFSYYADQGTAPTDFTAFSIMFAILLLFYTLWVHKIIKELSTALIATIFICTLLTHMMPAFWGQVAELDPYFHYRMADYITETGNVMEHDVMVYPPEGADRSTMQLFAAVFMASVANILGPLGFTVEDAAVLWPGVIGAFTVLVFYLLLRDLFADMKPYNYVAALLGAFMLMLTPGFGQHSIATNCEDDALGMFLMVSSFFLMVLGFRARNLKITLLAGFSLLMLNVTWAGYSYAGPVIGVFMGFYALMNFIHKKNTVIDLPYFIIPVLISFLAPLILHAQGKLPVFTMPAHIILIPVGGAFLFAVILEIIRSSMYGKTVIPEKTIEDKIENLMDKYILPIGVLGIIIGIVLVLTFPVFSYLASVVGGTEVRDIIGLTTAEQIRQTYTIEQLVNSACCTSSGFHGSYGIAFLLAFPAMIIILSYFALVKRSMGAAFILAWSVPMIIGVYSKPQYTFVASVPIVALGATAGLLAGVTRKDLEGWRIIATILIILIPLAYIPFAGADHYSKLGTGDILYTGSRSAGSDVWMPALVWFGNQSTEGATITNPPKWSVLAWWDYGHWIAAISKRVAVADNAKNNEFTVQNDAKFHVLVKTEEEAVDIARKYDVRYVAIDWTMIGKSHAPHFIATSNLTTKDCGFDLGYGQLRFVPAFRYGSNAEDVCNSKVEQYALNDQGGVESTKCLGFIGGPGIGAVLFFIKNNAQISSIYVITPTGDKIPWETWSGKNNVSILGVHPINSMLGLALQGQLDTFSDRFIPYNTLVYVPNEFDDGKSNRPQACVNDNAYNTDYSYAYHNYNDYMLTKLYLGDYADTYYNLGLCKADWCAKAALNGTSERLKYFKVVDEFDGIGSPDYSNGGYVRVYKVTYPEEIKSEEEAILLAPPSNSTGTLVNLGG